MQETNHHKKKLIKIGPYVLLKPIGKGSYSVVYEAQKQNENSKYAIKKISLESISEKQLERIHLEVNVLSVIKHKNIIQLVDSKKTSRNLYLVF